jgi:hypothetical protein
MQLIALPLEVVSEAVFVAAPQQSLVVAVESSSTKESGVVLGKVEQN